jgi:hypothetical protein
MTERSIADLIGWQRADDNDVSPTWWDAAGYLHDRWTADDLLAWLREQGIPVEYRQNAEAGPLRVGNVMYVVSFLDWSLGTFPTLLAALEAAVRAVAS